MDFSRSLAGWSSRAAITGYLLLKLVLGFVWLGRLAWTLRDTEGGLHPGPFVWAGGLFLAMAVSALLLRRYGDARWFGWTQLLIDTAFVATLVSASGGPTSPFFLLFFVNIVAAGFLVPSTGPLGIAGANAAAYALVLGSFGIQRMLGALNNDPLLAYTHVLLQFFAFLLVGMLSTTLSSGLRRARQALMAEQRQNQLLKDRQDVILANLDSAVLLTDTAGAVVDANPAARRLFGDVVGTPVSALFSAAEDRWEQSHTQGEAARTLLCSRSHLDGGEQVVVVEDITELRRMEAAVAREERLSAVGRLAAGLAHEIRNPLASLSGSVQLLQTERQDPLYDIMLREVQRLNGLVEDFLDSARPAGVRPEWVEPAPVVDELLLTLRNDPRFRDRALGRAPAELPVAPAWLDPARFRQLLWNLLLNAAQATRAGGTVTVELHDEGADLVMSVRDDGVGVSPELLPRIFDPFFTNKVGGTGLGLANVERLTRAHGGGVVVRSGVGEGTCFTLRFPRPAARGGPSGAPPAPPLRGA
ncbi:MAG: hypothetical protein RL071_1277 [Pseudomonadota bacterium]